MRDDVAGVALVVDDVITGTAGVQDSVANIHLGIDGERAFIKDSAPVVCRVATERTGVDRNQCSGTELTIVVDCAAPRERRVATERTGAH